MKKLNAKGFTALEGLLLVVIVGVIGGAGYFVYNAQQKTKESLNAAAKSQVTPQKSGKKTTKTTPAVTHPTTTDKNSYYEIILPEGWKLSNDKPRGVSYTDAYIYENTNGKKLSIFVNLGNVGGLSDLSVNYTVVSEKISLPIEGAKLGKCSTDGYPCSIGDQKLLADSSSASKIKNNNYYFIYEDPTSESLASLSTFKMLVESMKF